jgi:hypothetical protein
LAWLNDNDGTPVDLFDANDVRAADAHRFAESIKIFRDTIARKPQRPRGEYVRGDPAKAHAGQRASGRAIVNAKLDVLIGNHPGDPRRS